MTNEQFEKLALDALFERRLRRQQCIVDNQAGEELLACPPAALPAIEGVIHDSVEVAFSNGTFARRDFHGLDYVLGAYLVISAKANPARAVGFLASSSLALQVEALGAMRTFFYVRSDGYVCKIAPPVEFRIYVERLTASENSEMRSAARQTLLKVVWGLPPTRAGGNENVRADTPKPTKTETDQKRDISDNYGGG